MIAQEKREEAGSEPRAAGTAAARACRIADQVGASMPAHNGRDLQKRIAAAANGASDERRRWLLDNMRLIRAAARETRGIGRALREEASVIDAAGVIRPRAYAVACQYLDSTGGRFSEETLAAFLEGYQETAELSMSEIWALKPALQLALLERIASRGPDSWETLVTSLRHAGEAQWKDLFESVSAVDRVLARDPARAYCAMDYESRDEYRKVVSHIARHCDRTEREVAEAAIELAEAAERIGDGTRAAQRRAHVGFYLLDRGLPGLRAATNYRPGVMTRLRDAILAHPNAFYLTGIELVTLIIVIGLLTELDALTPVVAGFLLLILPATQAAVEFMNHLATSLLRPHALAKLDFSKGIPAGCATVVAVPTLLLNEAQVQNLVLDLEIRFLANRDPNLYFALLTDSPDSDAPSGQPDALVELCRARIEELNRRYGTNGHGPFYMLHRHLVFNASEGRWMGWERKRGKLLDLNQFIRGGFDSFPVKSGDLAALTGLRYVITLDSDTQLPRGTAARLIGAMAHPLNQAVVDPATKMVVEGYGILQPRIGISVESAARSRLASLYSGQTGFDIYTRAISDVYQDLYGEGIFTGKGIYDIDAFRETLQARFPENALLSHDLIEGSYARAGLVSDIELIDDYPSHFSAYSRRKHRWMRGDWQILRWLSSRVPDYHGNIVPNPIGLIARWKIFDNLRRSLIEPNTLLLFLAGWLYLPGGALYWTSATVAMLFMPVYADLLFSVLRVPWRGGRFGPWAKDTAAAFAKGNVVTALGIVFLLHQALLSMDAIGRSMLRVFYTRRRLLEWETAAEAETAARRRATVDRYLDWSPWISIALAFLVWFARPSAIMVAAPVLLAWFVSRGISDWLNRAPRTANRKLDAADDALLRDGCERIWRFFHDWSTEATNWLIPDSVREDGTIAARLSPTNLGLLLNARVAAVHFGLLPLQEFVFETKQTLTRFDALPKYRGHLLNWYDLDAMAPLEPRFVSTVDSGNLVACLWTLKQAALSFVKGAPAELTADLNEIAGLCQRLAGDMDFSFLYQPRKKVLSVGYNVAQERLEESSYDLLASESRIASFVAIAKGDVPQEAWFHLGRAHTVFRGERVLISWTGTMFEYLMPVLWMRHHADTIMEQSMKGVVGAQREFARRKGVPWGISESACQGPGECDYGYAAFGIPELAMKRSEINALVVSPYSTFLALSTDPRAALGNLRRMEEFGWSGRYGFYEAIDYTGAGGNVIRSWMAHHEGMSLLAACNLLFDNPIQRYFHAEPQVMATELLLNERVPKGIEVDRDEAGEAPQPVAAPV